MTIGDVAAASGFYDQPSFTRTFARLAGETRPSTAAARAADLRPRDGEGARGGERRRRARRLTA